MTYLVLARKWRPQSWEDVVAQEHVTVTLKNAIQHNRLAHAYLFAGPRGVGKTSAARILAKTLNCEKGDLSPCNACSSCQEIAECRNVDVFEIDGASNRGIDEVRSLRENIRYTPAHGKVKVYIIDEVHMLTPPAFNALLKTLEEPPAHVLFIFATTEPHKVPATILSRCQRFDFRRIGTQAITERLAKICRDEAITIDENALHLIAKKADGSLRDSQSILDQLISFTDGPITASQVVQGLGLIDQELFFNITDVLHAKDMDAGMALVSRVVSGGYDMDEFLSGLLEHFRNLLVVKTTGKTELTDVAEEHKKRYAQNIEHFREEDLLRLIRIVSQARSSLKNSVNPQIPLELAMVKMIRMDSAVSIEDLIVRLERLGKGTPEPDKPAAPPGIDAKPKTMTEDTPVSRPPGEKSEKKKELSREEVEEKWDSVIQQLKHRKITIGSFLQEGVLLGVEGNEIQVGFAVSNGFHIDAIMRSKEIVLAVIRDLLGSEVTLRCVKKASLETKPRGPEAEKKSLLDRLGTENPALGKMIDDWDAEIVR